MAGGEDLDERSLSYSKGESRKVFSELLVAAHWKRGLDKDQNYCHLELYVGVEGMRMFATNGKVMQGQRMALYMLTLAQSSRRLVTTDYLQRFCGVRLCRYTWQFHIVCTRSLYFELFFGGKRETVRRKEPEEKDAGREKRIDWLDLFRHHLGLCTDLSSGAAKPFKEKVKRVHHFRPSLLDLAY